MLGIGKYLLLLLFKISNQAVELVFHLAERFLVLKHFEISIAKLRVDILQWVGGWITATWEARFLRETLLFVNLLLSLLLITSASLNRTWSIPSDIVLANLTDEANALQHICDIVNTTLLHFKILHSFVQIERLFRCLL